MRYNKLGFTPLWTTRAKKNSMSQTGFTLSELMIAAVILAFVCANILLFFINSIFLNESNRNRSIAISHAQYALEELKNLPFGSINSTTWDSTTLTSKGLNPLSNESLVITVTGTKLLDIAVTVNWRDHGLRSRSVSLNTLIAEP